MSSRGAASFVLLLLLLAGPVVASEIPDVSNATLEDHVTRVIDGDTLELRGGETVRLLGIDTPETDEPFYLDAKLFLFSLVCYKDVRLELDETEYDAYYRLLAHVYVETEDGWVLANEEVVRAGLADLLFIPPNDRYHEYFETVLYEAILARRGMWGAIAGILTVPELEADLVTCSTEVVAVRFTVGRVEVVRDELVLYAEEGDYGFNVRIGENLVPELDVASIDDLLDAGVTVTGVLSCDVRLGPYITVENPSQLVFADD
jgi:endonuclease YncB( thermonuclease family)